jgi:hypothetical protein
MGAGKRSDLSGECSFAAVKWVSVAEKIAHDTTINGALEP